MSHSKRVQCKNCKEFVKKEKEYYIVSKRTRGQYGTTLSFKLCESCKKELLGEM